MNREAAAAAEQRTAAYLNQVAARLRGPRRRRARILAELRDGLHEAAADRVAAGLPAEQAVDTAVAQFGDPAHVADAFAAELSTAYARHTLAWFVLTGPLVGIWWLILLHPYPWRTGLLALLAAIPVIPLVMVALATAAGTLAATGRLMRWLPEAGARRALTATAAVAGLTLAGDVTVIGAYLHSARVRPLAGIAITASLIRIGCSLVAIGHSIALRHRITHPGRTRA